MSFAADCNSLRDFWESHTRGEPAYHTLCRPKLTKSSDQCGGWGRRIDKELEWFYHPRRFHKR